MKHQGPRNTVSLEVGRVVRALRVRDYGDRYQTLRGLARQVRTSATHISDIENGRRRPSLLMLVKLAKALRAQQVYAEETCEHCRGKGKQNRWNLKKTTS